MNTDTFSESHEIHRRAEVLTAPSPEEEVGWLEEDPDVYPDVWFRPDLVDETPRPRLWENGRRLTSTRADAYEWWYLDGQFTNGMMVEVTFFYCLDEDGTMIPRINLRIVSKENSVLVDQKVYFDPAQLSISEEDIVVSMGSSYFRSVGGRDVYEIFVDPIMNNGFGVQLMLERSGASFRLDAGHTSNHAGDHFFAWLCAVPAGLMTGTITARGKIIPVDGSGYQDHCWGDDPINLMLGG
ncbi:MAG: hypothetical protein AAGF11_15730 [Myxococcota bacterium]